VADWIYWHGGPLPEADPGVRFIVDAKDWRPGGGAMPCFTVAELDALRSCNADAKFLLLTFRDWKEEIERLLCTDERIVVIFYSSHPHFVGEARAFMHRLLDAGCETPVLFRRGYEDPDPESIQVKAATDLGALLIDGFGNGILLEQHPSSGGLSEQMLVDYMFGILQAARVRISKTEYISCPGCGRTLFHLQQVIARVKAATVHLKGLKIAVMGCIVNGPGEMADADYGYVGAGRGRVSLYKGKACVLKNIPEEEAVAQLLALIREDRLRG
jgi:(E)-4-hydroxy-3-methylbut-2-enyl-diphosphate synthase